MGAQIDLLGCEYLGGCPAIGSRVLNKVEVHLDRSGVEVRVAPQGLFTLAAAHPVLALAWPEITALSASTRPESGPSAARPLRAALRVLSMRLDLPDELTVSTTGWTMTIGVRVDAATLNRSLHDLLATCDPPAPTVPAG